MQWEQAPIRIVARAKLSGLGEHVGVQLPNGAVVHRTPVANEVVSFNEFAQGKPVRELRRANPSDYTNIMQRVAATVGRPANYRLGDNNCEHYANWLVDADPRSPQVAGLVIAGIAALALTQWKT